MNKNKTTSEKYLKTVIYDRECLNDKWFHELLSDLINAGIDVKEAEKDAGMTDPGQALYICANEEGIELALRENMAFVCYGCGSNEAQCVIEGFDEVDAGFIIKMYQRKHGQPWKIAGTERLIIREFTVDDGVEIFPEISDVPGLTALYIKNVYGFFGYGVWALVLKNTGEIIGKAGLMSSERVDGIELGYEISEPFRHRGFAKEACIAIIKVAEEMLGQERLYAFTDRDNKPSKRLLNSLGFECESEKSGVCKYIKILAGR